MGWVLAPVFMATFFLQIFRWRLRRFFEQHISLLFINYFIFAFMTFLFFAAIPKDIFFAFFGDHFTLKNISQINAIIVLLSSLGILWGIRTALSGPIVRKVHVPLLNEDFRIAQISDLHVSTMIKAKTVQKIVDQVSSLNPDLIAITGDIADGFPNELKPDLEPLRNLKSRYGVFYVSGNHETYYNLQAWHEKMHELGFNVLNNSGKFINLKSEKLFIAGVPDFSTRAMSNPEAAISGAKHFLGPKILLAHQPKSYLAAAKAGFDLMLSGHTHWGQFFPFSLVVGFFNPYHKGLNRHENLWIYTNAGTGFWGPPVRLWVPAEITQIELRKN